jgi:hypothetical protein
LLSVREQYNRLAYALEQQSDLFSELSGVSSFGWEEELLAGFNDNLFHFDFENDKEDRDENQRLRYEDNGKFDSCGDGKTWRLKWEKPSWWSRPVIEREDLDQLFFIRYRRNGQRDMKSKRQIVQRTTREEEQSLLKQVVKEETRNTHDGIMNTVHDIINPGSSLQKSMEKNNEVTSVEDIDAAYAILIEDYHKMDVLESTGTDYQTETYHEPETTSDSIMPYRFAIAIDHTFVDSKMHGHHTGTGIASFRPDDNSRSYNDMEPDKYTCIASIGPDNGHNSMEPGKNTNIASIGSDNRHNSMEPDKNSSIASIGSDHRPNSMEPDKNSSIASIGSDHRPNSMEPDKNSSITSIRSYDNSQRHNNIEADKSSNIASVCSDDTSQLNTGMNSHAEYLAKVARRNELEAEACWLQHEILSRLRYLRQQSKPC